MRSTVLLFSLVLVACSAPASDDDTAAASDSNLTEKKILTFESYVTGDFASSRSEAHDSLAHACDAAKEAARAAAGAKLLDSVCGQEENRASGPYFLLGAKVTTRVVADVESGKTAAPARTTTAIGTFESSLADGYDSWNKACAAENVRAKALFGDRFLGGGCQAPKNTASGPYFLMASEYRALVLPLAGESASIAGAIRGEFASSMSDGIESWKKACAAWAKPNAGARLVAADCGEPVNTASGPYFMYGSKTQLSFAGDKAEIAMAASNGARTAGEFSNSLADGIASWQKACDASIAQAKTLFGDRFVGGTCAEPTNIASGPYFLHASSTPIVVVAAGKTKVTLEGWVFGDYSSSLGDGAASLQKNAAAAIADSVAAIGAARVEGFEVGAPTNAASGPYFLYGAPTKITIGIDLAEGALDPLPSTSRVQSEPSSSLADAADSWARACKAAVGKAKADKGERFLGAACGKPAVSGTKVESDFTVWIAP